VVALTAQDTRGVTATHEVPQPFIVAQLDAVFADLGIDAVKTGALVSAATATTVAEFLETMRGAGALPALVIDPVLRASTGAPLLDGDGVDVMRRRLLPLAAVVTPNRAEAVVLAGGDGSRHELAERIAALGAGAVVITGGDTGDADHLFDGRTHIEIEVRHVESRATHGSGCTHSATLCAELAKGADVESAARRAAAVTAGAVARGLADVGDGEGPVDVIGVNERRASA
jgi:hydroxymethylpyrimidine/phosphomethylpyrimidine kinase